eukprot:445588_1
MEYYESVKTGVEIRRTLTSCDNIELANFMQKLTELLITSDQKNIIYKFIIDLSYNQNYETLQKIQQILPICKVEDSISQSMNIITKTLPKRIKRNNNCSNNDSNTNSNLRSKRHRNRRKKK